VEQCEKPQHWVTELILGPIKARKEVWESIKKEPPPTTFVQKFIRALTVP
jgi:hypothetical protein